MQRILFVALLFIYATVEAQCDTTKLKEVVSKLEAQFSQRPGVFAGSFKLKKDGDIRLLSGSKSIDGITWLYDYKIPVFGTELEIKEKKGKPYWLVIYNEGMSAKYIDRSYQQVEGDDDVTKIGNATVAGMDSYIDQAGKQYIASVNVEKKIEIELKNPTETKLLFETLQCILTQKQGSKKP